MQARSALKFYFMINLTDYGVKDYLKKGAKVSLAMALLVFLAASAKTWFIAARAFLICGWHKMPCMLKKAGFNLFYYSLSCLFY